MMKLKYIDIHTHVNFTAFDEDRGEVITRAKENDVGMIIVGTQEDTSRSAIEIAKKHDKNVFATVGLHPAHTAHKRLSSDELGGGKDFTTRSEIFDRKMYESLAKNKEVVAIGECGLDYYRLESDTKKNQQDVFEAQIALAHDLHKPLMVHGRPSKGTMDAYEDILSLLEGSPVTGNIHFFVGSQDIAERFFALGFTISFTGVLTFTRDYDEVIRNSPLSNILSETDAPFLTPVPHRGERNEPSFVPLVVKRIAEIRGENLEEVENTLLRNAERVFGLPLQV